MTDYEKIERAKVIIGRWFSSDKLRAPTQSQIDYHIGFGVLGTLYGDWDNSSKILYSIQSDNFVDWGKQCCISVADLERCSTPEEVYHHAVYAKWTDKRTQRGDKAPLDESSIPDEFHRDAELDNSSQVEYNEGSREKLVKLIENIESQLAEAKKLLQEENS